MIDTLDTAGNVITKQHTESPGIASKGREEVNTGLRALKGQHAYAPVRSQFVLLLLSYKQQSPPKYKEEPSYPQNGFGNAMRAGDNLRDVGLAFSSFESNMFRPISRYKPR